MWHLKNYIEKGIRLVINRVKGWGGRDIGRLWSKGINCHL